MKNVINETTIIVKRLAGHLAIHVNVLISCIPCCVCVLVYLYVCNSMIYLHSPKETAKMLSAFARRYVCNIVLYFFFFRITLCVLIGRENRTSNLLASLSFLSLSACLMCAIFSPSVY